MSTIKENSPNKQRRKFILFYSRVLRCIAWQKIQSLHPVFNRYICKCLILYCTYSVIRKHYDPHCCLAIRAYIYIRHQPNVLFCHSSYGTTRFVLVIYQSSKMQKFNNIYFMLYNNNILI